MERYFNDDYYAIKISKNFINGLHYKNSFYGIFVFLVK